MMMMMRARGRMTLPISKRVETMSVVVALQVVGGRVQMFDSFPNSVCILHPSRTWDGKDFSGHIVNAETTTEECSFVLGPTCIALIIEMGKYALPVLAIVPVTVIVRTISRSI